MSMTTYRSARVIVAAGSLVFGGTFSSIWAQDRPDDDQRHRALHVLNRLTFGPRPGDVERVVELGVERFIGSQLRPDRMPDQGAERYVGRLSVMSLSGSELAAIVAQDQRERQARQRSTRNADTMEPGQQPGPAGAGTNLSRPRRLAGELQQAAVARAVLSQRQLYEVMVDFWTNHFNVFLGKGADRFLLPDYIEHTIRPRALGRFEDLLIATAKSPAMLFYLDNVQSVAPGSEPPQLRRQMRQGRQLPRRPGQIWDRPGIPAGRADSLRARIEQRRPRGLNENYARELLELHTLGVDGGYSQDDIVGVARILTGWSMIPPLRGPEFGFNDWAHDRGEKMVLGSRFPGGRGMEEGMELLRLLARHPSTLRHVSGKLCAKFVSDTYSPGCVDAAARAWERHDGEIRQVLAAIFASPEFWAAENRGTKIKTPLEFVASATRAIGAEPDTGLVLAQLVGRLGQPLYLQQPPTGYPETQEEWVNSSALLQRMNLALGIAAGRVAGAGTDLDGLVPLTADADDLIRRVNQVILHGQASTNTLAVMRRQVEGLGAREARTLAVGLALGSPEFQRQ